MLNNFNRPARIITALFVLALSLVVVFFIIVNDRGSITDNWIDQTDNNIDFSIRIFMSYNDDGTNRIKYYMNSSYLSNQFINSNICVDSILLQAALLDGQSRNFASKGFTSLVRMEKPICSQNENVELTGDIPMPWIDPYYYPYDRQTLAFIGNFHDTRPEDPATLTSSPGVHINWNFYMPGRQVKTHIEANKIIIVELQRPLVYRVLTPLVLGTILLFIFAIPIIKSTETFIEITVALFFGLWGARQILIVPSVQVSTVLDPIFLALYLLTTLAIVVRSTLVTDEIRHLVSGTRRNFPITRNDKKTPETNNNALLQELLDKDTE